jgi:hypothetical protein
LQPDLRADLSVGESIEKQVHDQPVAFVQLVADVLIQRAPADLGRRGGSMIGGVDRPSALAAATSLEADDRRARLFAPVDDGVSSHPAQPAAQARSRFLVAGSVGDLVAELVDPGPHHLEALLDIRRTHRLAQLAGNRRAQHRRQLLRHVFPGARLTEAQAADGSTLAFRL